MVSETGNDSCCLLFRFRIDRDRSGCDHSRVKRHALPPCTSLLHRIGVLSILPIQDVYLGGMPGIFSGNGRRRCFAMGYGSSLVRC